MAEPAPLVSVVMPTRDGERWLREAIDSILDQEGVDLELVVADHASTDSTPQILADYADDPRVRLLTLPDGGGAQAAWNAASEAARGTYVKLVCHDDILRPGVLARQAALLAAHPDAAMTACRRDVVDGAGRTVMADWGLRGLTRRSSGATAVRRAVRQGINPFGEPACVMTPRVVLDSIGHWDGRRPYVLDLSTYFRMLAHGSFVPDLETGAAFRVSEAQLSFALKDVQAAQVTALHREVLRDVPAPVRWPSLLLGAAAAHAAAVARRLVYRRTSRAQHS